ncbi:MAG: acyclic terpene utilization AtuA family protein [Chitinivibrionales bacterium]|nr:acyclic terpene utilization AtuA family protein [Chitinivibrionales bacterium]
MRKKRRPRELRILSPTAILGYGFPESSFRRGLARRPHLIAVDAGSTDPGPYYLGSGKPFTDRAGVKRDLRYMLKAGVARGIPVVVGTAGGSGAAPHLAWCERIVREIAREEKLSFTMGVVPADVPGRRVAAHLRRGEITPLACVPDLSAEAVRESVHIVAQMGMEPVIAALDKGCSVVLCGRCYDPAVFAALPVSLGFDPGPALHLGKILECAAIAATPGSGSDCALGLLHDDHFVLEPLSDKRRFTRESVAAHTLYEKSDPYHLPGPGGVLDLEACRFTELDKGRVKVSGSRFVRADRYLLKLEGARLVGHRTVSIAGTRDPIMIASIDRTLVDVQVQVRDILSRENVNGRVHFHIYGKNGVMGPQEPLTKVTPHELGIVIEAIGETQRDADTICSLTRSSLLHYGYPGRIATAGNLAFPFSPSDLPAGPVYEFSLHHLMPVDDGGRALFPVRVSRVGTKGGAS